MHLLLRPRGHPPALGDLEGGTRQGRHPRPPREGTPRSFRGNRHRDGDGPVPRGGRTLLPHKEMPDDPPEEGFPRAHTHQIPPDPEGPPHPEGDGCRRRGDRHRERPQVVPDVRTRGTAPGGEVPYAESPGEGRDRLLRPCGTHPQHRRGFGGGVLCEDSRDRCEEGPRRGTERPSGTQQTSSEDAHRQLLPFGDNREDVSQRTRDQGRGRAPTNAEIYLGGDYQP